MQPVDWPNWENVTLLACLPPASGEDPGYWASTDVFRTQMEIGHLSQGWSILYSRGSGEGGFLEHNAVSYSVFTGRAIEYDSSVLPDRKNSHGQRGCFF